MIQGDIHPDFWAVARALEQQVRGSGGGAAVCVYHRGVPVVDIWAGVQDERGTPWRHETTALSFSTTKGVTSTALHLLADRGLVDYDAPVAEYWPEFAAAGKEAITVRHLLCHEAGMYRLRGRIDHADRMLDWDHVCSALAAGEAAHEPGTRNAYHGMTFGWLVGEVIQRVSGMSFSDFIRKELAEPLGVDGLQIGVPREDRERVAQLLGGSLGRAGEDRIPQESRVLQWSGRAASLLRLPFNPRRTADALVVPGVLNFFFSPDALDAPIPAANGTFTARSLARLYAMLAGDGEIDGKRLLSTHTVMQATEVQNTRIDGVVPFPMRWRLGYHLAATTRGVLSSGFGHFGYGGSGAWAEPERELAVAMVTNQVAGTPFGDLRMLRLGASALRCADAR
ncbi:MAG: beta-lactamase family protein [Deltaproteobacteria bacterium]|nr:beta-lactamase family protein [Deltaproteobacteria bacterium]